MNKGNLIIINKLKNNQLSELDLGERIIRINTFYVSDANENMLCEIKKMLDKTKVITIENEAHQQFILEKKNILELLN